MINWARVDELRNEIGQEGFDEIVDIFLEEVEQVLAKLRDTPDRKTLREDLHFLKGCALNLGFSELASRCQAGETACAQGEAGSVDVPAVLKAYSNSKLEFVNGLES
ncbi:Hpt domain-containing protein [Shimia sp. SDUM112013]|uniref:Hpt domain-containing protein n=1 Tax=Shimia sp. SDUM112013 TaxID=3136160 RepID=UPI0032F001C4